LSTCALCRTCLFTLSFGARIVDSRVHTVERSVALSLVVLFFISFLSWCDFGLAQRNHCTTSRSQISTVELRCSARAHRPILPTSEPRGTCSDRAGPSDQGRAPASKKVQRRCVLECVQGNAQHQLTRALLRRSVDVANFHSSYRDPHSGLQQLPPPPPPPHTHTHTHTHNSHTLPSLPHLGLRCEHRRRDAGVARQRQGHIHTPWGDPKGQREKVTMARTTAPSPHA
jgi:hypothetical protein